MPRGREFSVPLTLEPMLDHYSHPANENGCRLFRKKNKAVFGYGFAWDRAAKRKVPAHRLAYQMKFGPIPADAFVLHKCDVPACMNPDHLYLGDQKANVHDMLVRKRQWQVRKTHCKHGHEFTEENTYRVKTGGRHCRACHAITNRRQNVEITSAIQRQWVNPPKLWY